MKQQLILGLLPGLTIFASSCGSIKKENKALTDKKPNVIFIYSDDLGIGDLSCYGATKVHTPNIDKLSQEGLRFCNAY
ncbi:MAG: sulfatase-like hydrolase/transferase, partial [Bacteroidaceae bacterium]